MKRTMLLISLSIFCLCGCQSNNRKSYVLEKPNQILVIKNDKYGFNYINNGYMNTNGSFFISWEHDTKSDVVIVRVEDAKASDYDNKNYYGMNWYFYYGECSSWEIVEK